VKATFTMSGLWLDPIVLAVTARIGINSAVPVAGSPTLEGRIYSTSVSADYLSDTPTSTLTLSGYIRLNNNDVVGVYTRAIDASMVNAPHGLGWLAATLLLEL
jgi:hypothetical protein